MPGVAPTSANWSAETGAGWRRTPPPGRARTPKSGGSPGKRLVNVEWRREAVKWNLRQAAARRNIWRSTQLHAAFKKVGFNPSLSKVAALWSNRPITVRLDDLDMMCTALDCTVNDLLEPERVSCQVVLATSYEGPLHEADDNSAPAEAIRGS